MLGLISVGLAMLVVSGFSAVAGLVMLRNMRSEPIQTPFGLSASDGVVFLYQNRALIDATPEARSLLARGPENLDDWDRFISVFGPRFTGLSRGLIGLAQGHSLQLAEDLGGIAGLTLHADRFGPTIRIAFDAPRDPSDEAGPDLALDPLNLQALESELAILRNVAEKSPILTWYQQPDNTVLWANSAYMQTVKQVFPDEAQQVWPPRCLVTDLAANPGEPADPDGLADRRISLPSSPGKPHRWLELSTVPAHAGTLCFATPIDSLVRAETALRDFIGTLGKTFAQLPIGLAIFDADRRLALFNPALVDLTALGAEVLSQRPTLHAFLDALRENQRIPEPRDYKSWRMRIAQLETAATDGRHQEIWTLPTGQTYRITGQPHPNGAIAFLFEDISSEISLKRRFRSEIDLGLAVLNAMGHGVAVFDGDGTLALGNTGYKLLWGIDPNTSLSRISLKDCFSHWGLTQPDDSLRAKLAAFILHGSMRDPFCFWLDGPDGAKYRIHLRPLPRRCSLMEFHYAEPNVKQHGPVSETQELSLGMTL